MSLVFTGKIVRQAFCPGLAVVIVSSKTFVFMSVSRLSSRHSSHSISKMCSLKNQKKKNLTNFLSLNNSEDWLDNPKYFFFQKLVKWKRANNKNAAEKKLSRSFFLMEFLFWKAVIKNFKHFSKSFARAQFLENS